MSKTQVLEDMAIGRIESNEDAPRGNPLCDAVWRESWPFGRRLVGRDAIWS